MASLNRVILIGNLTRDPELRSTPSGVPVATLGLAVNRRWASREGEGGQTVDYFNVIVWRKLAELCSQYLKKGSPIAVDGRLQSRSWETAEGQKRSTVEIVAENVQFLGRREAADVFGDVSLPSSDEASQLPSEEKESAQPSGLGEDIDVEPEEAPF